MSASVNDKVTDVRNAARPNSARATGTRSAAGTSLACDNLAGWPTASKVHFVTYQINSSSEVVAGTQLDCSGIVSGNTIGSITVIDGSDTGNSVGDVVEMLPTAAWGQDLADALTNQHSRAGAHTAITATSISTTGNATIGGNSAITGNETVTGNLAVTGTTTLTGATTITALSNPYKFFVYRSAAWTSGSPAIVLFDTKLYDTGSNVDVITNKGRFTAPVAGFYQFSSSVGLNLAGGAGAISYLYKNGSQYLQGTALDQGASLFGAGVSIGTPVIQLAANDYIEIGCYGSGSAGAAGTGPIVTWFSGFLLCTT